MCDKTLQYFKRHLFIYYVLNGYSLFPFQKALVPTFKWHQLSRHFAASHIQYRSCCQLTTCITVIDPDTSGRACGDDRRAQRWLKDVFSVAVYNLLNSPTWSSVGMGIFTRSSHLAVPRITCNSTSGIKCEMRLHQNSTISTK
jgi:hypothetical protein